jgi:hypothetical protein
MLAFRERCINHQQNVVDLYIITENCAICLVIVPLKIPFGAASDANEKFYG